MSHWFLQPAQGMFSQSKRCPYRWGPGNVEHSLTLSPGRSCLTIFQSCVMIDIKIAIVSLFGPLFHRVIYLNLNSNINKKMYNYHLFLHTYSYPNLVLFQASQKYIFSVTYNNLFIIDGTPEDSGVYSCSARNLLGQVTQQCNINIDAMVHGVTASTVIKYLSAIYMIVL